MKRVFLLISLVVSFWSSCTSATTTPNQVVVRDIEGEILSSDTRYFVVSAINGAGGGGVFRGPVINEAGHDANFECPSEVVQSPLDLDKGMSVYFLPKATEEVLISESSDVNIEFYLDNPTICNNSVWEVQDFPGPDIPMYLSTYGEAGNVNKVNSWFQIKKVNDFAYKLVFCPYGEHICTDIGIDYSFGQRRLAIRTDNTFHVVFIKDPYFGIKSIV